MNEISLYKRWMEHVTDAELREELAALAGQEEEIAERFYRELEFGTGGLRGVLGAGSNRMNLYTVGKASQGYANYLKARFPAPSVAVSYDSRIHSDLFARHAAAVFAANGVAVHLYPRLMPTPALSFAVRDLRCSGGVMITASHNPAPYNGYKVYGSDGCQITTEAAAAIQREIDLVDCFDDVPAVDYDDLCRAGRIAPIGEDTVERYLAAVDGCSLLPEGVDKDFSIVYTPLNGAGISCVPRCLRQHGFTRLVIPPEQGTPDGRFPTCPYPNPEIREALEVGLRTARETGSELLLATDPDCDRVGVAVREGEDYTLLNGNETGVLLFDFVCRMRRERGTMPQQPVAVKTIVTTPMAEAVARDYGVELINVLTGFKYIGEKIGQLEQKGGEGRYIFGFEESYGYLSGSYVRDKDGVNASLLICEMFAWYRGRGMSLVDGLRELQRRCGVYQTKLLTYAFEGAAGFAEMERRMNALRAAPPAEIGGETVTGCLDYDREGTGLPRSNVLRFLLEQGEAVIRPSGTEPKLKVYLTYWGENGDTMEKLCAHFDAWAR
ncbi:MAG: phospho-sugar mutase [Oscillospiraceae bacterium]|nr:phospho-sugar mutase [Oscillospiraceae bacterium]